MDVCKLWQEGDQRHVGILITSHSHRLPVGAYTVVLWWNLLQRLAGCRIYVHTTDAEKADELNSVSVL